MSMQHPRDSIRGGCVLALFLALLCGCQQPLAPVASATPSSGPPEAGEPTTGEAGPAEEAPMNRDDLYRDVLAGYDQLTALWKQQPADPAALRGSVAALREDLELLADLPEEGEAGAPTGQESEGGAATAPAPGGPVGASAEPSSEESIRKREEATERFYGVAPPEAGARQESLAGVPDGWIQQSVDRAGGPLADLEALLASEEPDRGSQEAVLTRLGEILAAMAAPPAPPPTDPGA